MHAEHRTARQRARYGDHDVEQTFSCAKADQQIQQVVLGGTLVDLRTLDSVLQMVAQRASAPEPVPLAVTSANLDHIHHFGSMSAPPEPSFSSPAEPRLDWLNLLDGAPLVAESRRLVNRSWPRLAGSDLIHPILETVVPLGLTVGFLGGSSQTQEMLKEQLAVAHPGVIVAGMWAPARSELSGPAAEKLVDSIARAAPDILVVGLGKPRQEEWIASYGLRTNAKVLLAFGAVVDFLAGRVRRAPGWVSDCGFEWLWRLAREPRRLARRYLLQGPRAYACLRRNSYAVLPERQPDPADPDLAVDSGASPTAQPITRFASGTESCDIAICIVTHNNEHDVDPLIKTLRASVTSLRVRVVVVDNASSDQTVAALQRYDDIEVLPGSRNLGYAGGINKAMTRARDARAILILNPDLTVDSGALLAMYDRMIRSSAGIVVPLILDGQNELYPSIRREPGISRALGDALLGGRLVGRPGWLSEVDSRSSSYRHAHHIDWATGAAMLISSDAARRIGSWDERYFLYSEETDYFHRARAAGQTVVFEPYARVHHAGGGSGQSPHLVALMAVNRCRYIESHHARWYARTFRGVVILHMLLRARRPAYWQSVKILLHRSSWRSLTPTSEPSPDTPDESLAPAASVVIPAHNEEHLISATLSALAPLATDPGSEVIVVCNGCTDQTATIASGFAGVTVIEMPDASKSRALNRGDAIATKWPRIYLDGDVTLTHGSVAQLAHALNGGGILAARPAIEYDLDGASRIVRRYFRTRMRLDSAHEHLWGAGVYALSQEGHGRLGRFPDVVADDLFVDNLFATREKAVIRSSSSRVRVPVSSAALLAVLRRVRRGNRELDDQVPATTMSTVSAMCKTVRSPSDVIDSLVFGGFSVLSRFQAARGKNARVDWERDWTRRSSTTRATAVEPDGQLDRK